MNTWAVFWGVWLLIAGASFVFITIVVAIKGLGDLLNMLRDLSVKK